MANNKGLTPDKKYLLTPGERKAIRDSVDYSPFSKGCITEAERERWVGRYIDKLLTEQVAKYKRVLSEQPDEEMREEIEKEIFNSQGWKLAWGQPAQKELSARLSALFSAREQAAGEKARQEALGIVEEELRIEYLRRDRGGDIGSMVIINLISSKLRQALTGGQSLKGNQGR